ncbi:ARPP-1 family domain-containing protein [Yinghuangia sp. YIM S09857]|uniref:ARPP-1 family domain-containing protein n=1 Tax=Yinghuangia sp. YIM S09857 TaxID=3436929 RepID=UPI003F534AF8
MRNPLKRFQRAAAESATVGELLSGVRPGRVQSAGRMQVLPLLAGDAPTAELGDPARLVIATGDYGTLDFRNEGAGPALVPSHLAVMVSQAAQDHAMPRAALVAAGAQLSYRFAMCIQQSQGGLISSGSHRLAVLPPALREAASLLPAEPGYNRLWPAVSSFKASAGLPGAADLVRFMKHFATELDRFTAEFECVEDQIGAVVLMDGAVVGVERAPSHVYWRSMWEPLIRFCYGAEAVRRGVAGDGPAVLSTRVPLTPPTAPAAASGEGHATGRAVSGGDGADVFALLAEAVRDADAREQRAVEVVADAASDESLVVGVDEAIGRIAVGTVVGDGLMGAYALDGDTPVYASLTVRGTLGD